MACGRALPPSDIGPFFDRLAESHPGYMKMKPPGFEAFRALCDERETKGRERFGLTFYRRDNVAEALEEAADGANYAAFEQLVASRDGARNDDDNLLLLAAYHAAQMHRAFLLYRQRRRGAP